MTISLLLLAAILIAIAVSHYRLGVAINTRNRPAGWSVSRHYKLCPDAIYIGYFNAGRAKQSIPSLWYDCRDRLFYRKGKWRRCRFRALR